MHEWTAEERDFVLDHQEGFIPAQGYPEDTDRIGKTNPTRIQVCSFRDHAHEWHEAGTLLCTDIGIARHGGVDMSNVAVFAVKKSGWLEAGWKLGHWE